MKFFLPPPSSDLKVPTTSQLSLHLSESILIKTMFKAPLFFSSILQESRDTASVCVVLVCCLDQAILIYVFLLVVDYSVQFSSHWDKQILCKPLLVNLTPLDAKQLNCGCFFFCFLMHCMSFIGLSTFNLYSYLRISF